MNSHEKVQQLLEEVVLRPKLCAAAAGKSASSGGLNMPEIKKFIESKKDLFNAIDGPIKKSFPDMNMSRADLNSVLTEIVAAMSTEANEPLTILNSTIHDASRHDEHELVERFLNEDPSLLNSRDQE